MGLISRIFVATLTYPGEDAGTRSSHYLTIDLDGQEVYNGPLIRIWGDTGAGNSALFGIDASQAGIDSSRASDLVIRIGIKTDDEWRPNLIFAWAKSQGQVGSPGEVVPLAFDDEIVSRLSVDDGDDQPSARLHNVGLGDAESVLQRVLIIVLTHRESTEHHWYDILVDAADAAAAITLLRLPTGKIGDLGGFPDAGTDSPVALEIAGTDGVVLSQSFPGTPQEDLEAAAANVYALPSRPFSLRNLRPGSVALRISGDDQWFPAALFIYGLTGRQGRPSAVVPLVHIENWENGPLSTDPTEGKVQVLLPLVSGTALARVTRKQASRPT